MNRYVALALVASFLMSADATAQTVRADRFTLNTGPCTERSGIGSPEGVVTGIVCDQWHRTDTPFDIYRKISGSGNTGWKSDTITGTVGTVTSVSVTTANGVSGSVATSTTTPAITLTLGAITPSSVASTGAISVDGTAFAVADTTGAISTTAVAALTTAAESWVGPSTTTGVYFKGGKVGIGTTTPTGILELVTNLANVRVINASQTATTGDNYGIVFSATGVGAAGNTGIYVIASGATTNTGIYIDAALVAGANNFAFYSASTAKSYLAGGLALGAPATLKSYTVATLPTGVQGYVAYVTDALAPTFMATVVGGGAVVCVVFYNGSTWVAF